MASPNGDESNDKISSELVNSFSSKSGMSFSCLAKSNENFSSSQGRSFDDYELQNGNKQAISLTASTSLPNLSDLGGEVAPDVNFWQDLDLQLDFFDQDISEQSPQKPVPEAVNVGVADDRFGTASKRKLPPKLMSLDPQHFYQHSDKPERSIPSGSSSSKGTKSSSMSSGSKMDVSIGSERGFRNTNSMSMDSRDTMAELAQRIEPVGHDDIEFAPLDLTLSEELHLHLSSSYSMSVDERLVKYASTNTTPLSTLKTFDYPDSFSMSSWSQHTISQDVFAHHKARHHENENVLDGELWNAPSVELDMLDLHDGYAPPPTLSLNHGRHSSNQNNHSVAHNPHLPPQHSSHHNQHSAQQHNSHHAPSLAQQNYAQMHPPAPPVPKPSPGPRGPRPPIKQRSFKANGERSSIGENVLEGGEGSPKSPKSARKGENSPASIPLDIPVPLDQLQVHISPRHSPRQSPQMPPLVMQNVPALYTYPTAFQQGHAGLAIHTNSPASPLHGNITLSPTQYLNGAPLAPLYDPVTGVVYYPQIPANLTMGQGPLAADPSASFFAQMHAAPGVNQRAAASFRLHASGFPTSGTGSGSPVSPDGAGFDSISATMLHGSGSTSTTVTPTGAQLKKDKKDKNRGSYRCGRCGKPKVNHVCAFVDAVTVSQAVQAKGVILNPNTMQPYVGDRVLTVNTVRKSIQDDDQSFESFGMKATSGSFTLGSKTPSTMGGAVENLSVKSGLTDRTNSNLTSDSLLARTNSNLTGESLLVRTHSGGSDIFDSLSRSNDEVFSPKHSLTLSRSPHSARPSVVFSEPVSQSQAGSLAQAQLSSESDDVFFPNTYPPKTGVMSSRNSSINEAESDTSSLNGDNNGDSNSVPKRSTLGNLFSTDLGLSKFFQF